MILSLNALDVLPLVRNRLVQLSLLRRVENTLHAFTIRAASGVMLVDFKGDRRELATVRRTCINDRADSFRFSLTSHATVESD